MILALKLDPTTVEEGGMGKWDGMIALAVGFLWTEVFDNDGIKAFVGDQDGIRILLELMMHDAVLSLHITSPAYSTLHHWTYDPLGGDGL